MTRVLEQSPTLMPNLGLNGLDGFQIARPVLTPALG